MEQHSQLTQQEQSLAQPQPLTSQDRASSSSSVRGPLWTAKLNLRLLSISISTLLLIIVFSLLFGSSNDAAPIIMFGPITGIAFAWSFMDSMYLWTGSRYSFKPSLRMCMDLILSLAFLSSSLLGGYFGPADHPASGSAPTRDESHLGRRALGCFGLAQVFVHVLLVAIAYYERKIQADKSTDSEFRDEEERLLVDEEATSNR
ncbi:hypothetical protein NW762_012281 [Fusarium torreyae]|uniref:Uncharacterized protein n=1 Tax=Fusarium torreyae TaxID=1237075 RepID=A0A9W8VBG3_9HYPO|nr:hypothetical protein NW762_012281 [Fusarium torreyae]